MIALLLLLALAVAAVAFTFVAVARDGYRAAPAEMSESSLARPEPVTPITVNRLG
jgi:hypothetical protein